MLRPLTISDPAFLARAGGAGAWGIVGTAAPISEGDANTLAWYKATESITEQQYIGNRQLAAGNRASAAYSNLIPYDAAAILCPRNSDYYTNFLYYSESLSTSPWNTGGSASVAGNVVTFTGSGDYIRQYAYMTQQPGHTYRFRCLARRTSGDIELYFRHSGSAGGSATAMAALTSGWVEYECTFTGPSTDGSYVDIGFEWASGSGDVEITEVQVHSNTDQPVYLATTDTPRIGARGEVKCWCSGPQLNVYDGTSYPGWKMAASMGASTPYVATAYLAVYIDAYSDSGYGIYALTPSYDVILSPSEASGPTYRARMYSGATWRNGAANASRGGWSIVTWVVNGGSSEVRVNKDAATVVNAAGGLLSQILTFGNGAFTGYERSLYHEFILRNVADNTATQNTFIDYLASWVGLSL